VNRSADVSVVTDDDATAALMFTAQTGTSISGDGQLVVDGLSDLSGGGDAFVTPDGTFVFGDHAAPSTTFAFSMTNQLASSRTFDVAINNLAPSGADLVMTFYASDGTEMSVADSSTDATGITPPLVQSRTVSSKLSRTSTIRTSLATSRSAGSNPAGLTE